MAAPLEAQPGASSAVKPADINEQVFVNFKKWASSYTATAAPEEKAEMVAQGVKLARERRPAMLQFIVFDPQRAFELAVPIGVRQQLPPAILAELEERLSGRSEFGVLAAIYVDRETGQTKTRMRRTVVRDGTVYHASVYGSRLGVTTKSQLAWHGIALDNYIAIYDSPVRRIEPAEKIPADAIIGHNQHCPVCSKSASDGLAADIGGIIYFFDTEEHLDKMEADIRRKEGTIDPEVSGLELLKSP